MNTKTKAAIITVVSTVVTFFLGNIIWPIDPHLPVPSSTQMPLFIILSIVESIAFGVGASLLVLGWQRSVGQRLVFISLIWLLASWWPHDNMHKHNGAALGGLLLIEYLFHVTLILASAIVAYDFWKRIRPAPDQSI